MGQESRFTLARCFCSKVSYKPAVKKSTRASHLMSWLGKDLLLRSLVSWCQDSISHRFLNKSLSSSLAVDQRPPSFLAIWAPHSSQHPAGFLKQERKLKMEATLSLITSLKWKSSGTILEAAKHTSWCTPSQTQR